MAVKQTESRVGALLRDWRQRRRLSQLDLALAADSSSRHISYMETGRAKPSRAMILRLCDALEVPLRERNTLLLAADYAPAYRESSLDDASLANYACSAPWPPSAHPPMSRCPNSRSNCSTHSMNSPPRHCADSRRIR